MSLRLRHHGQPDETRPTTASKWSINRLVSRIVRKFDGEKANADLRTDPSTDVTPRTSIHDLPVELLLEICQYPALPDVYSLMRVNKTFHEVGVQRLYALIPVHIDSIDLPPHEQLPHGARLEKVLPHLKAKRPDILWGLFASQKHLDAVRTVAFYAGLNTRRYGVLNTLVQNVFLHCTKIRNVRIFDSKKHDYLHDITRFISFQGIIFPESLSTVQVDTLSNLTQTLLASITSKTSRYSSLGTKSIQRMIQILSRWKVNLFNSSSRHAPRFSASLFITTYTMDLNVFKEAITWKKSKEDDGKETWTLDPMIAGN